MLDPLGDLIGIRDYFVSYIETAFRIRDDDDRPMLKQLAKDRKDLLIEVGQLCADWFIEPLPRYKAHDLPLEGLVGSGIFPSNWEPSQQAAAVELLLCGLFPSVVAPGQQIPRKGRYLPYTHQIAMLEKGIRPGTPAIITSGTGSGKTESFLAPIIATIARESLEWDRPDRTAGFLKAWWKGSDGKPFRLGNSKKTDENGAPIQQRNLSAAQEIKLFPEGGMRAGEAQNRPKAVRALILYPMNALVEDQMVRLRKALDSAEARDFLDRKANGNRIFFGRYTSATPVTGTPANIPKPPRLRSGASAEEKAAHEKLKKAYNGSRQNAVKLSKLLCDAEGTQNQARWISSGGEQHDGSQVSGMCMKDHAFQFMSTDGAEMPTRWDMQTTPPDILITNVSMLNAMLTRKVEEPIFDQTAKWLDSDEDAYFYLVLDELHLQRGSAGSEIACLLRSLIFRLGLHRDSHRHKLRILASSASLPVATVPDAQKSCDYLYDLFGRCGFPNKRATGAPLTEAADRLDLWQGCIITHIAKESTQLPLPGAASSGAFRGLPQHVRNFPRSSDLDWGSLSIDFRAAASAAGNALGIKIEDDASLVRAIEYVGHHLLRGIEIANISGGRKQHRAIAAKELANALFGEPDTEALRGMMILRGIGDHLSSGLKYSIDSPSFRLHGFLRSFDGLFATIADAAGSREACSYCNLAIERSATGGPTGELRRFEMLYCECCGEVMIGGLRGGAHGQAAFELLPTDPDLDSLPDTAKTARFEDLSHREYALVWPTRDTESKVRDRVDTDFGRWRSGSIDPKTGRWSPDAGGISALAFIYPFNASNHDPQDRFDETSGSAVPRKCPSCGTDYSRRRPEGRGRMSPIRSFRPGFGKTTQLLASELFAVSNRSDGKEAKLISFSDSRQEAARAALDIQDSHHQDLLREVVYSSAHSHGSPEANQPAIIPLEKILERIDEVEMDEWLDPNSCNPPKLPRTIMGEFATRGLNPADPLGQRRYGENPNRFDWFRILGLSGMQARWLENFELADDLKKARKDLVKETHREVNGVIFGRNYFSFESAGLGYVIVNNDLMSAPTVRILADSYRVDQDQYRRDQAVQPWLNERQPFEEPNGRMSASTRQSVCKALGAIDGKPTDQIRRDWWSRIGSLGTHHRGGVIKQGRVQLVLVHGSAPYWSCKNCGRIHLYYGINGHCTRCGTQLPPKELARGAVADLRQRNFLGLRALRGERFTLRCEELTGQTDDYGSRQRNFRGIFLDDTPAEEEVQEPGDAQDPGETQESDGAEAAAPADLRAGPIPESLQHGIDLLTVTTTMEVGIDIGSLRTVLQANMPPQRFNYQQRVGRSGRRGQAFSCVMTVCRSRSHDLHYFRHPAAITGSEPPPPFLTLLPEIPERVLRKQWLIDSFRQLSLDPNHESNDSRDIHGEFISVDLWTNRREEIRQAMLSQQQAHQDRLYFFLRDLRVGEEGKPRKAKLEVEAILSDIDPLIDRGGPSDGLGERLAEAGLFPMFGMPTRVRSLIHGQHGKSGRREWSDIGRDLDLAIFEFAPGRILVKDKKRYQTRGLIPGLSSPPLSVRAASGELAWRGAHDQQQDFVSDRFKAIRCPGCGGWTILNLNDAQDTCACQNSLRDVRPLQCLTPKAFLADFKPVQQDAQETRTGGRSVLAEAKPVNYSAVGNVLIGLPADPSTVRLNTGPDGNGFDWQVGKTELYQGSSRKVWVNNFACLKNADPDSISDARDIGISSLGARKATHLLMLRPAAFDPALALGNVKSTGGSPVVPPSIGQWAGIRASALSATFLLTGQAALEMDIDPDEFDILEPRLDRTQGREEAPIMQFADQLVNGSGYVRWLASKQADGTTPIARIILTLATGSPVSSRPEYRADLLNLKHRTECRQSCYGCLQRYRNQPFHSVLDWRLGMDFLSVLADPSYRCGLDGEESAVHSWQSHTETWMMDILSDFFKAFRSDCSTRCIEGLAVLDLPAKKGEPTRSVVLRHPLWATSGGTSRLQNVLETLSGEGRSSKTIDSFNLLRRPSTVASWLFGSSSQGKRLFEELAP